jgi:hypothetical protein
VSPEVRRAFLVYSPQNFPSQHHTTTTTQEMTDKSPTADCFADHYRTGKYADLRLVTATGLQLDVHRLVVCSQSPILDAKVKTGAVIIELDDDDDTKTVEQMIEWMYGIDDQELLLDRKTLDEVVALGPDFVCGETLAVASLAGLAAKVCWRCILPFNGADSQVKKFN